MTNSKSLHFNCSAVSKFIIHSHIYYLQWLGQCHAEPRWKERYPGFEEHLSFTEILPLPHGDIFLRVFLYLYVLLISKSSSSLFSKATYHFGYLNSLASLLGEVHAAADVSLTISECTEVTVSFMDVPPGRSHRAWCISSMLCCYHLQILNIFYTGPHELCSQHW